MRRKIKTVMEQMNAEKPDDLLADLERKHGCAAPTGSASCVVEVKCSKCKWGGRFSMNPSKPEELEKRIATDHAYAKTGWQCDGKLTWTPNAPHKRCGD